MKTAWLVLGRSAIAWMMVLAVVLAVSVPGQSQGPGLSKGNAAVVTQTASFGSLVPAGLGAPAIVAMPFHLSIPRAMAARGYRLSAVSNFVFSPSKSAAGGKSIAASDIGVGITGISLAASTAADIAVTAGFDYDPAGARNLGGGNHYAGAAAGRANLSDLLAGRDILRVGRMAVGGPAPATANLTLTVKLAVQPQFLTPGGFSGTITVTAAE